MIEAKLIPRLHALRRTIRRRLLAYGLCALGAGAVTAFVFIITLDWFLWLPAVPRIAIALLFVAGLIAAILYWVVKPMRTRLGIDQIAGRLERHFGHLEDRLTSTVNFLDNRNAGSPEMMSQVVSNTDRLIADLPLESALSLKPLVKVALLCSFCAAGLATMLLIAPGWARTGSYRYLYPFGRFEWPHSVSIQPLTADALVAIGESVTVRMRVVRGLHEDLRGVVHLREPDGSKISLAMQREAGDTFYTTIDAVTTDLVYWFEAGDDDTRQRPSTIRAVRRPEVVEATVSIEPPPYAVGRPVLNRDLSEGAVRAPLAGHVSLTVRSSKPIPTDLEGRNTGLYFDDDSFVPFAVDPQDRDRLSARFEVTGDARFRIALVDEFGLENRGAEEHRIIAVPDKVPTVTITEPKALTELTPSGSVRLRVEAEDDFGLTRLDLEVTRLEGDRTDSISLTDRLVVVSENDVVRGVALHLWSMEPLSLSPGDVLIARAAATDNCTIEGQSGQVSRSTPLRIKIISDVEFEIRVRDDLTLLENHIRRAMLDQAELLDQTTGLIQSQPPFVKLSELQREAVDGLAGQQARLVRRLRDLSRRFRDLGRRMEFNKAGDEEARRQVAGLAIALRETAAGPMTAAANALNATREQLRADPQQQALTQTTQAQHESVDRLRALIRTMARWGDFHGLLTKTRDLLERQRSIRTDTTRLGQSAVGKSVGALSPEEATALNRTRRRQEQLAREVEQLLAKMRQLAQRMRDKDPSGAGSVEAATRAAQANDVSKRMRSAGTALQGNRTAAAALDQKLAEDGMRKMVDALRERDERELALLRKRVARAEEQVARLIAQQEALRAATAEAAEREQAEEVYLDYGGQQRALARNTRLLSEELSELQRAAEAAQLVRQAAGPMREAENRLREQKALDAVESQDLALDLLRQALAGLEQLARQTDEEALRRSLAQIHDELAAMLEAQKKINTGIESLADVIKTKGRVTRLESREARRLSRAQVGVLEMVDGLRPELEKVVVYEWALKRVADWMKTSRSWLDTRKIDEELIAVTRRIVRELQRLISAIDQTQSMPLSTEFVEQSGGGGGEGAGAVQGKPVPTIAELLVLKAMQADICNRTREIGETLDPVNADELQLREIKMLGEDQAQVRRLTEMVTRRARQP
jgi:hypothetical protein